MAAAFLWTTRRPRLILRRGDANALYKLGDMVGKHLLPDAEGTALDYYKKAFDLVKESKDPYSYPDICLRLARYNPPEKEFLLEEAVTYFKIRIEKGDNFTANVLRSAERELANCKKRS
jgi:TPR repeat protein